MYLPPLVTGVVTPSPARKRGAAWVLLVCGVLLVAAGGALLIAVWAPQLFAELIGATWRPEPAERAEPVSLGIWVSVGWLLLFGAVTMSQGVWGLCVGEMNRLLLRLQVGLFLIFVIVGAFASVMSGHRLGQLGGS